MKIAIINYGAGNIQSIKFAAARLGYNAVLSSLAEEIKAADKIIFPGVGQAGSAMRKLKDSGLDVLIPQLKQPVLGICLGMQLMCSHTEEGNTKGLGIFDTKVKRFDSAVKVPQIGWNQITFPDASLFNQIDDKSYVYLVHSYYVPITKNTIARSIYGVNYTAALEKDNFYGTQFHPEKSGAVGEKILANFFKL